MAGSVYNRQGRKSRALMFVHTSSSSGWLCYVNCTGEELYNSSTIDTQHYRRKAKDRKEGGRIDIHSHNRTQKGLRKGKGL